MTKEVLLIEHVEGLGIEGDIVKVSVGYARNYLLPNGYASDVGYWKLLILSMGYQSSDWLNGKTRWSWMASSTQLCTSELYSATLMYRLHTLQICENHWNEGIVV